MRKKYIFVSGGNVSGLGKGITASSIGLILKAYGWNVTVLKIDPYLNVDAGTMSPFEHGETFVTKDGKETDLDLGNYERFLDIELCEDHNLTTGKAYLTVINKERKGEYLGKTVQVVPHITDYIISQIKKVATIPVSSDGKEPEICIIELGGTVGDIESSPFLEAISQLTNDLSKKDYCCIHITLVPKVGDENKTKPTQHSMKEIKTNGLFPDILCLRCEEELSDIQLKKVSRLCHIPKNHIIVNKNVPNIYYVPDLFLQQNVPQLLHEILKLPLKCVKPDFESYNNILNHFKHTTDEIVIGIVGKYLEDVKDTYLSLFRAIEHASFVVKQKLKLKLISSENQFHIMKKELLGVHGIIIPGGFGQRGIEGMIQAANFAHEQNIPLLGICLGMQIMVIERARTVMGWTDANSTEFNPKTSYPVIKISDENDIMGGTMRLGESETVVDKDSVAFKIYNSDKNVQSNIVFERHRHRYEGNLEFIDRMMEKECFHVSGWDKTKRYIEIIEDNNKNFWIGVQFHPEFKSRHNGHPIFIHFLQKCKDNKV